ncbi:MAG: hypothetical protein OXC60_14870 [Litoreibacter sp.]|nr:hypothetical protein [Litoreibacter sp.]
MADPITLLTAYYFCSAVAETAKLNARQALLCSVTYEQVKVMFLNKEEQKKFLADGRKMTPEMNKATYLRFKEWEAAHPEDVARMKARVLGASA